MPTQYGRLPGHKIESAEKILKAAFHSWNQPRHDEQARVPAPSFITISRQPGTGADPFSHSLAERLNQIDCANWSAWDDELMEKVSADHGIAKNILDAIERRHSWMEDLLQSLSMSNSPEVDELRAYKKMIVTIHALAEAGRAIMVAEGSQFITEGMPGGIHVRLVAPFEHRIQYLADTRRIPLHKAAEQIVDMEQRRSGFYHQYWSGQKLAPEIFTLTLNTAALSADELVECVIAIVRRRDPELGISSSPAIGKGTSLTV